MHYRIDEAPIVDAAVLEEAAVFNGEYGLHKSLRHLVVGNQAAFGSVDVLAQSGYEHRFQLVTGQCLAVVVGDRFHLAAADMDVRGVRRVVRLRAGADGDGLRAFAIGAQLRKLRCAVGGVARIPQFVGDQADSEPLPRAHLARRGKDLCGVGKDGLAEPRVHYALVFEVVKAGDSKEDQCQGGNRN